jgi:hypothetical protein
MLGLGDLKQTCAYQEAQREKQDELLAITNCPVASAKRNDS